MQVSVKCLLWFWPQRSSPDAKNVLQSGVLGAESLHYCITLGQPLFFFFFFFFGDNLLIGNYLRENICNKQKVGERVVWVLNLKNKTQNYEIKLLKSYTEGNFSYNYKYTILDWKKNEPFILGKKISKYLYNSTAFLALYFTFMANLTWRDIYTKVCKCFMSFLKGFS